ncbi:Uncharacterised protein [Mycobacteroides abscessus subsp. abscessus]|nr:Uncharacterised protein [Mycobacteroides abscessus subsp. abscessus]
MANSAPTVGLTCSCSSRATAPASVKSPAASVPASPNAAAPMMQTAPIITTTMPTARSTRS